MKEFRELLTYLRANNQIVTIDKEVDAEYELSAIAAAVYKRYGKSSYFSKVKDSNFPVVSYVLTDRRAIAESLNMRPEQMTHQWSLREESKSGYNIVTSAPVQEIIEHQPDLSQYPLGIHSQGNNGRYITGGVLIARDPGGNSQNASFNRCQLAGKNKLRVRMMPPQHLGLCFEHMEKQGKDMPCSIVIGAPPSLMYSAASKIPFERDELEFAGALSTQPLDVIKCVSNDLLVPAAAEIVMEGRVLANVRELEGPFGEFTDSFVPAMKNHVMEIECITRRRDAIFHDIFAGGREDVNLLGLPIEAEIFNHIRKYIPIENIKAIAALPFVFGAFISIRKSSEEQVKNVLLSALSAYAWTQFVVVVDEDVDIYDPDDVFWAIQTRLCPQKGVMLIPGVSSYTREDVKDENIGKLGLDATAPLDKKHVYQRRVNPRAADLCLEHYLQGEK
jgi:UbiD family decarboxylase